MVLKTTNAYRGKAVIVHPKYTATPTVGTPLAAWCACACQTRGACGRAAAEAAEAEETAVEATEEEVRAAEVRAAVVTEAEAMEEVVTRQRRG